MAAVTSGHSRSRSWADYTDEVAADVAAAAQVNNEEAQKLQLEEAGDSAGAGAAYLAQVQPMGTSDEPSSGSVHHRLGRCKPCAFYHTKGCQNDKACLFCHLCPPGEKQRRKRLRERMCEKLGQNMQKGTPFDSLTVDRRFNSGHMRQASGASTSASSSTQSTCDGGWTKFSHSRQSSGTSAHSTQEAGMVGMQMGGNSPHMHQMMPVFHFAQHMVHPMAFGTDGNVGMAQPLLQDAGVSQKDKEMKPDDDANKAPSQTIALAQALPQQANSNGCTTNYAGQQPGFAAPWNGGVVQYALVQIPIQPDGTLDDSMPWAYCPQQPQSQMQVPPGSNMQYCVQDIHG